MNNFNPLSNGNPPAVPTDFNSRDPLVNDMLGNAYHIVREVYLRLGDLSSIYDFLQQFGLTTNVAVKSPVEIVSTSPIVLQDNQTITWSAHSGDYSEVAATGMRVLVTGQTNPVENGIYIASFGKWKRALDFDGLLDVVDGSLVFSTQGDAWQVAAPNYIVEIGVDPITFRDIDLFAYESRRLAAESATIAVTKALEAKNSQESAKISEQKAAISAADSFNSASAAEDAKNRAYSEAKDAIDKAIRDSGFAPVDSFEEGFTLSAVNTALRLRSNNSFYSWRGALPKVVPAGSTPETTGGFASDAWVDVNDLTLRSQLKGSRGFNLVGDFFNAEGAADAGISESINQRKGSRGHFAVFANNDIDETGAAMAFGGDDYTANLIVNWDGQIKSQHLYRGRPTSNFMHYPYIQNTGYLSASGFSEKRMILPSDGFSSDPNSPDIVFYEDDRKLLRMKLRMPGKFGVMASDEKLTSFIPTSHDITGFRAFNLFNLPVETVAGSNVPGEDYTLQFYEVANGSRNYNIRINTWAHKEVLSLWKTNLNKYLIFRIRDSSGGDTTKWGIYKIDFMYKESASTKSPFITIQFTYDVEPDGVAITKHPSKNTYPNGPTGLWSKVNYTDMKLVFTDMELPIGTGYSDPFGEVTIDSYGVGLAFGLKDRFRPETYVSETRTYVSGVNFDAKTVSTGTIPVTIDNRFTTMLTHFAEYSNSINFNKAISLTRYLGDLAEYGAVITSLLPSVGNINNVK